MNRDTAESTLGQIRQLLTELNFPNKYTTKQTAICLLALADVQKRQGLLAGKKSLNAGARIHDIIDFARSELGIEVAENTRESYRKLSLKPLHDTGLINRARSSVNDPNTHYTLNRTFEPILKEYLAEKIEHRKEQLIQKWVKDAPKVTGLTAATEADAVSVKLGGTEIILRRHHTIRFTLSFAIVYH
jgi:hypothetical protein